MRSSFFNRSRTLASTSANHVFSSSYRALHWAHTRHPNDDRHSQPRGWRLQALRGEEKQRMADKVALRAFSMTIAQAKAAHICIRCKRAPEPRIYSALGRKECTMSGMCEVCFGEAAAASGDVVTFAAASIADPKGHVEEAIAYILRQQAAASKRQG